VRFLIEPRSPDARLNAERIPIVGERDFLIRHLAAIGREAGLRELVAEVLSDNLPMLSVFDVAASI
jgi:hypothetical protein